MTTRFDFLIRPRRSLLRTAWISLILGSIPVFGVLYWQAIDSGGSLATVVHVHLAVFAVGLLTYWRQKSVFTGIRDDSLVGNGIFSPTVTVPLDRIRRVEFVRVEQPGDETACQFVALDADGRTVFRLRAPYWHQDDLLALAERLGGADSRTEPLTPAEFFDAYPGSAYWFERLPALRVGLAAVGILVAVLGVTALLAVAGMPTFFG
jgi:hypothetical protein